MKPGGTQLSGTGYVFLFRVRPHSLCQANSCSSAFASEGV